METLVIAESSYKYKIPTALFNLIFFLYLEFRYLADLTTIYAYEGFQNSPTPEKTFIVRGVVVATILLIQILPLSKFIYFFANVIAIFNLYPSLIVYQYFDIHFNIPACHLFLFLCMVIIGNKKFDFSFFKKPQGDITTQMLIVILVLMLPFIIEYKLNVNLNNLLLEDIYETRSQAKEIDNFLTSYLYSPLTHILIPIFLVYSIKYKKYTFTAVGVICVLYLFLCGAHKSVFFGIFVIFACYLFDLKWKTLYLLISVLAFLIITNYIDDRNDTLMFKSLFIRRTIFTPALLDVFYFDFFEGNPIRLSHSILKNIYNYPFDLNPVQSIGARYFGQPEMNANNGIVSDGYMNFGYWGVAIWSVLTGLIVSFINSLNISGRFAGVFLIFIVTINSSAFLTILLTHGGFILLICSWLFLKDTDYEFQ